MRERSNLCLSFFMGVLVLGILCTLVTRWRPELDRPIGFTAGDARLAIQTVSLSNVVTISQRGAKLPQRTKASPKANSKANPIVIGGFIGEVAALKFSPDSDRLVVQMREGDMSFIDVTAGSLLKTIESDKGPPIGFKFDKEGKRLVTVKPYWASRRDQNQVTIWDAKNFRIETNIPEWWGSWPLAAGFQTDTDKLLLISNKLSASEHPRVLIQSLSSAESRIEYLVSREPITQLIEAVFSEDGKYLATVSCDDRQDESPARLCVWDMQSFRLLHSVADLKRPIWNLQFSGDGKRLGFAIGHIVENTPLIRHVRILDVESGNRIRTLDVSKNLKYPFTLSFHGERFATAMADTHDIQIWDLAKKSAEKILPGRTTISTLAFSPNDKYLAVGGVSTITASTALNGSFKGDPVFIWKLDEPSEEKPVPSQPTDIRAYIESPQFGALAVASIGGLRPLSDQGDISQIDYGANGRLATLSIDTPTLRLWDVETGKVDSRVKETLGGSSLSPGMIDDSRFAEDGKTYVIVSKSKSIAPGPKKTAADILVLSHRNSISGKVEGTPLKLPDNAMGAKLSDDCRWVAFSRGYKGGLEVWDVAQRKKVVDVKAEETLQSVGFGGKSLGLFDDRAAYLRTSSDNWELRTVAQKNAELKRILGVRMSADNGRMLVLFEGVEERRPRGGSVPPKKKNSPNATLVFWNLQTRARENSWEVTLAHIPKTIRENQLGLNADGSRAVLCDESLVLFDTAKPKPLGQLTLPGGIIDSFAFQPDGNRIAIAPGNIAVWIWDPAK